MHLSTTAALALVFSATVPAAALGQPSAPSPTASAPDDGRFTSPLRAYRGFGEQALVDWKAANDRVGRIGGWRTYAREAAPPEAASPTAAPASGAASAPDRHHGHAPRTP